MCADHTLPLHYGSPDRRIIIIAPACVPAGPHIDHHCSCVFGSCAHSHALVQHPGNGQRPQFECIELHADAVNTEGIFGNDFITERIFAASE